MSPDYDLIVNGSSITKSIRSTNRLISLQIIDKLYLEADELTLVLSDHDEDFELPPTGGIIEASIGYSVDGFASSSLVGDVLGAVGLDRGDLISAGLAALSYFQGQSINSYALNLFTIIWVIYIFTHLGVSFLISAVISTPGCEMRSLPHLWSIITGHKTYEHVCPGPLHKIDLWEQKHNE